MKGTFRSDLKDVIEEYGVPVQELAEETGISVASLYRYINDEVVPPVDKAILLADYLDYNVEDIWYFFGR